MKKIIRKILKESNPKQEQYLEKILNALLDETTIDVKYNEVHLPYGGLTYVNVIENLPAIDEELSQPLSNLVGEIPYEFAKEMDLYGLTLTEKEKLWERYGYEVGLLMNHVFYDEWFNRDREADYRDETDGYEYRRRNRENTSFQDNEYLNESTNEKLSQYYEDVAQQLVDETNINFDHEVVHTPFGTNIYINTVMGLVQNPQHLYFTQRKYGRLHPLTASQITTLNYIKEIYGATSSREAGMILYIYFVKVMERIDREWDNVGRILETRGRMGEARGNIIPPLDEEEDPYSFEWHPDPRKRKLYAAVLRDVVSDSIIGWDGVISVGDTQTSHGKGLDFHNLTHAYDTTPFLQHLKETYGLLMNETHPIWARWEDIMIDKIKKWLTAKDIKLTDAGYEEPLWDNNED